jgi:hypothetical protein
MRRAAAAWAATDRRRAREQEGGKSLAKLIEVKSLGGTNFVRPDRGHRRAGLGDRRDRLVMERGAVVNSSETTLVVAARLRAAEDAN